jgi:hypothetical protein
MARTTPQTLTGKCLRCGRTLRATSSITAGYGRICRARIRAAAITEAVKDFTAAQVDKARELLADGGLVPVRNGIWQAMSSDGQTRYLVSTAADNCPAGLYGRRCYHIAAARMITARSA